MKTRIKTGDKVQIISGGNKGKTGAVVKVSAADSMVFIEGIGKRTRHMRPTQYQKGGKKEIQSGIHISNVKLAEKEKK
jgi:large subunit ribosomal protein L24